eukprot:g9050.t1
MATDDDFLMGDDLFGSDFEDLISKDDLITSEGLNYFLGVDDQSNTIMPPSSASDTESMNSLASQALASNHFNDINDRRGNKMNKVTNNRDTNMWDNTLDIPSFDFDSGNDNFIFSDPTGRSDNEMPSSNLLFTSTSVAESRSGTFSTLNAYNQPTKTSVATSSNRKVKSSQRNVSHKKSSVNNSKSSLKVKGNDKGVLQSDNSISKSKGNFSPLNKDNNTKEEKVDTEEKRRRRLERNRESARQSRRRKKQYMELLEEKVEQLSNELNALRLEQLGKSARVLRAQRTEALNVLKSTRSLQDVHSKDLVLKERVDEIINACGCNTEERRAVLEYYFRMLNGTILPPYTRFLIWMVNQGEEFFSDVGPSHRARNKLTQQKVVASTLTGEMRMEEIIPNTGDNAADVITEAAKKAVQRINSSDNLAKLEVNNDSTIKTNGVSGGQNAGAPKMPAFDPANTSGIGTIWPLVSNELGLTYEQEEKMKAVFVAQDTTDSRRERRHLHVVNLFLSKLGEASILRAKAVHDLTTKMHEILTPVQSARFLLWMEKNRNRVHECGLDHLLASGNTSPNHPKATIAQTVASQFVNKSARELDVNEMVNLLNQIVGPSDAS